MYSIKPVQSHGNAHRPQTYLGVDFSEVAACIQWQSSRVLIATQGGVFPPGSGAKSVKKTPTPPRVCEHTAHEGLREGNSVTF